MRIRFAEELERGRLEKFAEGSKRFALTAEAMPFAPVTGGTKGQIVGGFILITHRE